ncbi:RagB/SusD family nutrient uptake outer membrane protein [Puteibacter caeruleilacunae]|nr:RagB/SusD family nutrient uptake outer membrane protein [Puteibacter caeruleilacunae]
MRRIYNKCKLIVFGLIALVGCTDHLDVDTFNNITGAGFWTNPNDAAIYAVGIQADVAGILRGNNNYMNLTDGRSDVLTPGGLGPRLTGHAQLHTQTALLGGGDWTGYYNTIHHCNLLLQEIEKLTFDNEEQKSEIAAKGHFFRAFLYFDLVRIYGDVPLVLEPTMGKPELETYYARAPKQEVFGLIKSDIEKAIAGLPEGIEDKNFISKAAAYALKAEVYMWTGKALTDRNSPVTADLQTAISAIDAIPAASGGTVSFVENDWKSIFTRQANDSPEYIWANFFDYLVDPKNNVFSGFTLRQDNVPDEMQGTFPIAYATEGLNTIHFDNKMNSIFDKYQTVEAHDNPFDKTDDEGPFYDTRDLRDINTMVDIHDDGTTIVCIKFPGILVETDNRRYWDNDFPIYRWSDMLLLKAEALNTLGSNPSDVVGILNMTRNRAGLADYDGATDKSTLENEILDERARELAAENKRWWDLLRAHKAGLEIPRFMESRGDDSTDSGVWDYYYWPISEGVMLKNNKIVQSAGY